MKVLSLLQPWATLIVIGAKKIETRSWNTKYRGPLLIHASADRKKGKDFAQMDPFRQALYKKLFGDKYPFQALEKINFEELPFGAIIGKVDLVDTKPISETYHDIINRLSKDEFLQEVAFGDYSPNRYGWYVENPIEFANPIPAKGQLNLWQYKGELTI